MFKIDVVGNVADSAVEGGGGISYAGDKVVAIEETASLEQSRIRDNKAKGPGVASTAAATARCRSPRPRSRAT